jgi:site-specific recombinase XerD
LTQPFAIEIAPVVPALNWLDYFSIEKGIQSVATHVAGLASSRTPEQSTRKVYEHGLRYLVDWLDGRMPTHDLMQNFIAHLTQKGLSTRTINAGYLAVTRIYLNALADQPEPGLTGETRDFVADCAMQITRAAKIKPARKDTTSYVAPLWNERFKRLSVDQVNSVLGSLSRTTLAGLRDFALLRIGFSTGLRLAELARITLASIRETVKDTYLLCVRGKRSNFDPVVLDLDAYKALLRWVMAFNRALPLTDARRIMDSTPVWQPLTKYGASLPLAAYTPSKGLSHQGLRDIIGSRTVSALGKGWRLAPHDLRRTFAALAYESGMALMDIQRAMRHHEVGTTAGYIGQRPDYASQTLANRVGFVS